MTPRQVAVTSAGIGALCLVLVLAGLPLFLAIPGLLLSGLAAGLMVRPRSVAGPSSVFDATDPQLGWVVRANGALAGWLVDEGGAMEASAFASGAGPEGMVERIRAIHGPAVERTGAGTLVVARGARLRAALLLASPDRSRLEAARADLTTLLDLREREAALAPLRPAQDQPGESIESMAMRLAHQVERIFDAEALVALQRPGGLIVMGVALRSDRRQLNSPVPGDSALARAMERPADAPFWAADPLGGVVADRRSPDRALVLPVMDAGEAVGAVAMRLPSGRMPTGEPWQELTRALAAAGPRLRAGLEARRAVDASVRDPLTGLLNRRGFEQVMRRVGAREGALVMLDLDRFKSLNDTLGHPAGDDALQMVARLLQMQIRDGDAAGRLGGEEMAIWLPGAALEQGREIAERIRSALEGTAWAWDGRPWPITASLGVAACPGTTASPENLMAQADRALYSAKQGGRNRVAAAGAI